MRAHVLTQHIHKPTGARKEKKVRYEPELLHDRETVLSNQNRWIAGLVSADLPQRVDPGTWTLAGHVGQAGDHQQRVISPAWCHTCALMSRLRMQPWAVRKVPLI